MFSKGDIVTLWQTTLQNFRKDFPAYDLLLREHGWKAGVREKKCKSFGWADPKEKRVVINWHLHKNSPEKNIVDTMLHEIAHAVDFCQRGKSNHDAKWKAIAYEIGAMPKATSKRALKVEYSYVVALNTKETLKFLKGYNRRPSGYKADHIMPHTYLTKNKDATENKIWLYSWKRWVMLCEERGISPYAEDHK